MVHPSAAIIVMQQTKSPARPLLSRGLEGQRVVIGECDHLGVTAGESLDLNPVRPVQDPI
jgi:hypothetical protein